MEVRWRPKVRETWDTIISRRECSSQKVQFGRLQNIAEEIINRERFISQNKEGE